MGQLAIAVGLLSIFLATFHFLFPKSKSSSYPLFFFPPFTNPSKTRPHSPLQKKHLSLYTLSQPSSPLFYDQTLLDQQQYHQAELDRLETLELESYQKQLDQQQEEYYRQMGQPIPRVIHFLPFQIDYLLLQFWRLITDDHIYKRLQKNMLVLGGHGGPPGPQGLEDDCNDNQNPYIKGTSMMNIGVLNQDLILVIDPPTIHHIFKRNFENYPKHSMVKDQYRFILGEGIFNVDGDEWKRQRNIAKPIFVHPPSVGGGEERKEGDGVEDVSEGLLKYCRLLCESVQVLCDERPKRPIEMQDLFRRLTLDASCHQFFSYDFDALSNPTLDHTFSERFEYVLRFSTWRLYTPFWKLLPSGKAHSSAEFLKSKILGLIDQTLTKETIKEMQLISPSKRTLMQQVLVQQFVQSRDNLRNNTSGRHEDDDGGGIGGGGGGDSDGTVNENHQDDNNDQKVFKDDDHLDSKRYKFSKSVTADLLLTFLMAARDTTASLLCWTLYSLVHHPHVLAKVQKELEECGLLMPTIKDQHHHHHRHHHHHNNNKHSSKRNNKVSSTNTSTNNTEPQTIDSSTLNPTAVQLKKLIYFRQVLSEVLRLYPSAPGGMRGSFKADLMPNGHFMPANTRLAYSPYITHRLPEYWGTDAELFDPDRWSPERGLKLQPGMYIPFNWGPRSCMGKEMALTMTMVVLIKLLQRFEFKIPKGFEPVPFADVGYFSRNGMMFEVKSL